MYGLLIALTSVFAQPAAVVAGDSVIVTVTVTDNLAAQPVSVDSVKVSVVLSPIANSTQTLTLPHASPTVFRFAYPLSLWAPNQTLGGPVSVWLGHVGSLGINWSAVKTAGSSGSWAWGYTLDATAPNPAENGTFTIGAALN